MQPIKDLGMRYLAETTYIELHNLVRNLNVGGA